MPPRPLFALLVAALICSSLAGCLEEPLPETEVTVTEALAFEPLGRGRQARIDTTERAILDANTWKSYQDSLRPLMPFATADFELEMVLLAALPVPTGGYDLRFDVIEDTGEELLARYRLYTPGLDCRPLMGGSVAFHAVRLGRKDMPVRFAREVERVNCTEPR